MKQIFTALLLLFIVGCYKTEYSEIMTENAIVLETVYTPSQHGTGTGFSSKGSLVITSIDVPEEYAVVFKCQHGKFIIKKKAIWEKLSKGDKVTIQYREVYRVSEKERILRKYDFIDAVKVD